MPEYSEYIDLQDGLKRIGGNKKIFAKLIDTFAGNDSYHVLCDAMKKGDSKAAQTAAHAIKGMAANLSMKALYSSAAELEGVIKAGKDPSGAFAEFKNTMENTCGCLQALKEDLTAAT